MGFYPINKITVQRISGDFLNGRPSGILVSWEDSIIGPQEKMFPYDQDKQAAEFASEKFLSMCM